jgi:hypothetical protein
MGFDTSSTNTFVGDSLTSSNVIKFIAEDTLFLHCSLVDDQTDVLQEINTAGSVDFGNITFNVNEYKLNYRKMKPFSGTVVNFSLTNEDGHSIDLNGLPMIFSLRLFSFEVAPAIAAPAEESKVEAPA